MCGSTVCCFHPVRKATNKNLDQTWQGYKICLKVKKKQKKNIQRKSLTEFDSSGEGAGEEHRQPVSVMDLE